MNGTKEYQYTVDSNGKRILDDKSELDKTINYLRIGNLYPFELDKKSLNKLLINIAKKVDLNEPTIFVYEDDIHKSVFGALLTLVNKAEELKGENAQHVYYTVSDVSHITQNQLAGEFHDSSEEFDNCKVLFVKMNFTDFPNLLNAYCIRNLAQSRKEKGLYTYFYFIGTVSEFLNSPKWKLDEDGIGQKGVIRTDSTVIDNRSFIPLTRYVKYFDIKKLLKDGGSR